MIEYCNTNQGFMSAIAALFASIVSIVAICISIGTTKKQNRIALFEKKYQAYNMISCFLSSMQAYDATPESVEIIVIKLFSFSNFGQIHIYDINQSNSKTQLIFTFGTYLEKLGLLFGKKIEKKYKDIEKIVDMYLDTLFYYSGSVDGVDKLLSKQEAEKVIPKLKEFSRLLAEEVKL